MHLQRHHTVRPCSGLRSTLCLLMAFCFVTTTTAFSSCSTRHPRRERQWSLPREIRHTLPRSSRVHPFTTLYLTLQDIETSNDPFAILGLDQPTADRKEIKRAYKRMALRYHPDVVVNKDSTPEEKKRASDIFSKINWAYEQLKGGGSSSSSSSSSTSSSSSSSSGWTPPHRRQAAERSSSYGSTDWQDYMPKYDEADYDAGGDSLGAIFSDLFAGAAAGAAGAAAGGGGGIFRDFVEFLEQTVDGYSSSASGAGEDDADLRLLLATGSVQEIGDEMDETDLVVQQLSSKLQNLKEEIIMVQADLAGASRYSEKLDLQERKAELEARKKVVEGYLTKARGRLLSLQTRYKELIVAGGNDARAGGGRGTGGSSSRSSSSRSSTSSSTGSSSTSSTRTPPSDPEDAWQGEGFGSFGRGSSRRRSSRSRAQAEPSATRSSSSSSSSSYQSDSTSPRQNVDRETAYRQTASSEQKQPQYPQSSANRPYDLPPHRRARSESPREEDKRRMSEMKVDEEFDKLKRDLGL